MTENTPPPPGWQPQPSYGAPPYDYGYGYGYGYVPPVEHRPGVVALRPLRLGDLFDGAFKTIRRNPQAMIGLAALVSTAFLVVPTLLTLGMAAGGLLDASFEPGTDGIGGLATTAAQNLGSLFGALATVLLNGMIVSVVAQAVLGRRSSMAEAWAATRGARLRLVALLVLNVLLGVLLVGVPVAVGVLLAVETGVGAGLLVGIPLGLGAVVLLVYLQVRYFLLAPCALVLERATVSQAVRRAGELSRGQWWRVFGIQLLASLVAALAGQVVAIPFAILGLVGAVALDGTAGALALVFSSYLSQILVSAVTTPFSSGVTALQYVDQRIRKEALDVQLIAAAQRGVPAAG